MPIYEYCCTKCGAETEHIYKIDDRADFVDCKYCGMKAKRVIPSRQGIQRDEPTWLADANKQLIHSDEKQLETRTDLNKHLKEKGIIHRA